MVMQELSTGAGLGALGFWLFIAGTIAAGVWDSIRKRDAQHETLRRLIESGRPIDEELTDKLLSITGSNKNLARDLRIAGFIVLSTAPGLVLFGWIMSLSVAAELLPIMLAVGALLLCISGGLLAAALYVQRSHKREMSLERR